MANYIEQYQDNINSIITHYHEKLDSGKLERAAHANLSRTDIYEQNDAERKRRLDKEKGRIKAEHRADAILEIEDAQRTLKREHEKLQNQIQRLKVKAATGSGLVSEYAKAHGLTESDARAELDDYAKVKTSLFADTLADRYAAIRNLNRVKDQDRQTAHQFAEQEAERLGIKKLADSMKHADRFLNQPAMIIADNWSIGENAVMRQFQQAFKE
jgi:hypothetical protein